MPAITTPVGTEPTGTGTTTGGGTTTTTTTHNDTPGSKSGIIIRAYQALGAGTGGRLDLPSDLIGPVSWTVDGNGGYTDFSLSVYEDKETRDFPFVPLGARFDAWRDGVRLFRGYAVDFVTSEEEPATLAVSGYGRIFDLDKLILSGNYQYPHAVDVATIFADVASDIQARFPDIVVVSEPVGIKANNVDGYRKSARDVLSSLYELVSSVATLGFDVDELTGNDRLFLRKKSVLVDHVVSIPGVQTGKRQRALHLSDLVNVVSIEGDEPYFSQLLPNSSFEFSFKIGEGGGNQIKNPSFEDGSNEASDWWYFGNGASAKRNYTVDAHTGAASGLVDNANETISQTQETPVYALRAGADYVLSFWVRAEPSAATANPPQIEARLLWRKADGSYYSPVTTVAAPTVQAWLQYQLVARCPNDATGFKVEFAHIGGSSGAGKGALLDDVAFYDNSMLTPLFWDIRQYGDSVVNAINWRAPSAYHGKNCLYIDCTAQDQNDHDLAIRTTPSYRFNVAGGQQLRYGFWVKGNVPRLMRQIQFVDKDNAVVSTSKTYVAAASFADWTYQEVLVDTPNAAVQAEAWITVRGSGAFYLDAISVRVADDGETMFIDAGPLFATFRADDLVSALEDAEVNGSIAKYGIREKIVKIAGIKSIADARAAAKTYLLNNASDVPSPVVDVLDYPQYIWPGDGVKIIGRDAARYADRVLPLARINGSLDGNGLVTHNLEIKKAQETEAELFASMAKRSVTRLLVSQGAQAGSLPSGGIVSGGVDSDA